LKRKLETIEKVEKLLLEEEKEIKESLAKVRKRILVLQEELERLREEIDGWTEKISRMVLPAEEVAEILSYIDSLSLRLKEVNEQIERERVEEKKLEKKLLEKKREEISFSSVKRRLEEDVISEERVKETMLLDEYTRIKNWIKAIALIIFFFPLQICAAGLEDDLEKPPPALVKILKKRERELQERESKLKIKEKFLQILKEDIAFLLNVIDEKLKQGSEVSYGASSSTQGRRIFSPEVDKLYKLVSRLPPDEGGQILSNVKPQIVAFLLLHINSMQAANLLANMDVKHAARVIEILYSVAPQRAKDIFKKLNSGTREERNLLERQ
jgi:flagellar motility protein MotE (MotC chaperone)